MIWSLAIFAPALPPLSTIASGFIPNVDGFDLHYIYVNEYVQIRREALTHFKTSKLSLIA